MANWSSEHLEHIVDADDLKIAPFRDDGATPGTPTWIWCVAVEGSLYVRAYHGVSSRWHVAAIRERAGQIVAAGSTYDVAFAVADDHVATLIDDAYRAKYADSPYLAHMIGKTARDATVVISPRR